MTIKNRLAEKYGKHQTSAGKLYTLVKIRDQSPVVYSADAMMKEANPRGDESTRCDDFVLCSRASVTGIYIVEKKEGSARSASVGQLRAGAKFISRFIGGDCCAFLPVLVARNIPSHFRSILLTKTIKLGNLRPLKIKHVSIGDSLPSILPQKGKRGK